MYNDYDSEIIGEQKYAKFSEAYREALDEITGRISCVGLYACSQFADLIALSCMIETPEEFDEVSCDLSDPDVIEIANAKLAEEFSQWHQSTKHALIEGVKEGRA